MRPVLTVAESRAADEVAVAAVGVERLIGRAAAAVATEAISMLGGAYGARVLVLAGSGHNGADALRAGALLRDRGAHVEVVRSSVRPGDEHVQAARRALGGRDREQPGEHHDLVLDGMVGVGAAGPLTGRALELARAVDHLRVLAVDVPSGLDADTGAAQGAVRAERTVTFAALKPGLLLSPQRAGDVVVAPIGIAADGPLGCLDADDVDRLLRVPGPADDKYSRGVVGVLAGSAAYPGAAVLAAGAAVRAGAGYVRVAGDPHVVREVVRAWPTAVGHPGSPADAGRVDAWVVGPGLDPSARSWVEEALAAEVPVLVDATGLELAGAALRRSAPTVITPHAGELRRLTGADPAPDRLGTALRMAADLGVTVLLKGHRTVVAAPDGRARISTTGTPWLATAGTGDVLAGATGALLAGAVKAGRSDLLDVVAAGAFVHGLAGQLAAAGDAGISADQLLGAWPDAVRALRSPR